MNQSTILSKCEAPKAVLFDIDGTLYSQRILRSIIVMELMGAACLRPFQTAGTIQYLRHFRRERENLRYHWKGSGKLEQKQYAIVRTQYGLPQNSGQEIVREWILHRPLKYLRLVRFPGLEDFLSLCQKQGMMVGAYSDYPTAEKIEALGIDRYFTLHLCSTDPEINAFKPSPLGILRACKVWGLDPQHVVYVGDRPEIDGAAAEAAGSQFVLMGGERKSGYSSVRNFSELADYIL